MGNKVDSVTIKQIHNNSMTITLEDTEGNALLSGVPINRILLCVMACSGKSDESLADVASSMAGIAIGTDARPRKVFGVE